MEIRSAPKTYSEACRKCSLDIHTARDRPEPTHWSRMVRRGAWPDFDGFLTTSETILGGVLITGGKGRSWEINAGLIWMTVRVESAANVSSLPGIVPNRRIGREHRPGWSQKGSEIHRNQPCAPTHRSRPVRRFGTIPGCVDISTARSTRLAIRFGADLSSHYLPRSPAISRDLTF